MNDDIKELGKQIENFKGLLDELKKFDMGPKGSRQSSRAKTSGQHEAGQASAPTREEQKKQSSSGPPSARAFLKAVIAEIHENPAEYKEISWIFELGSKYEGIREAVENIQKEIYAIGYDVRAIRSRIRREFVS
ncbi:MAG TPA: hypothetical protein PKK26_01115 [Candidatus Wallbacteria bacterium]|nr:hypothetical protein [Candidatus Wallbacteria bacterium]